MFPFSRGILEFQAMVKAGLSSVRALKAGVLAPGKLADIAAMPGDPITYIGVTAKVDFVMKDVYRHRTHPSDFGRGAATDRY